MDNSAYDRFEKAEMILRDHLALDRTILANERTLLAYVRTALAFLITGMGLLKFFEGAGVHVLAWVSIALSGVMLFWGVRRYWRFHKVYRSLRKREDAGAVTPPG